MTVRDLKAKLATITDDDLEVIIRCTWEGDEPAGNAFALRSVTQDIDQDTADPFLALDGDQDFDDPE
jgi:hypothetical protein